MTVGDAVDAIVVDVLVDVEVLEVDVLDVEVLEDVVLEDVVLDEVVLDDEVLESENCTDRTPAAGSVLPAAPGPTPALAPASADQPTTPPTMRLARAPAARRRCRRPEVVTVRR